MRKIKFWVILFDTFPYGGLGKSGTKGKAEQTKLIFLFLVVLAPLSF